MDPVKKKKILDLYKRSSKPEEVFVDLFEYVGKLEEKINEMGDVMFDLASATPPTAGPAGKNGKDGRSIVGPAGKNGSPDSPEEVRDKIASLKGKARLSIFSLKDTEWLRGHGNGSNVVAPSSTPGTGGGGYTYNEIPSGTLDGINTVFTLAHVPTEPLVMLVLLNGAVQTQLGSTPDYTITADTITFASAPTGASDSALTVLYS